MNRLLRCNQFSRYVRRYDHRQTKSGGALTPIAVVILGVGGSWLYSNREELFGEKKPEPEKNVGYAGFKDENRKDWEKYLPIKEKHRGRSSENFFFGKFSSFFS